ncbi:MAG TPA: quinolinate synthase NadA [Fimbriimonadaceae bacterium]|nr:quinolinate synthase NadA [Fimbriimonadaceae bacterium]HRJ32767.1 quinolinate synthase NadA [Fimbriimonadaceae bacterium]
MSLYQAPLPAEFTALSEQETRERILRARAQLGDDLVILGHHYQRDEIIEFADYRGDSYKLCKDANRHPDAKFIVFCGVHFMAESADILTPDSMLVILPNLAAGCSMADMANQFQVKSCWKQLGQITDTSRIVPVTYINSAANLKAFVGEHGGTVCTSTNAPSAVQWALSQGDKVLFFPDQHLGRNTGVKLGFDPTEDMALWDPFVPLGGNSVEKIQKSKFLLWKGHCSVHKRFTLEQIEQARAQNPLVRILVHPECPLEVVQASDLNGSTEFIIKTVEASEPGSAWAIGTEINLVRRLARENPDKSIDCLDPQICPCSTMYRIHPSFLCWVLEELAEGRPMNVIKVPEAIAAPARKALDQMLRV